MTEQPYSLVVWGATGFTGQLVVKYLNSIKDTLPPDFRWAVGGRSEEKVKASLEAAGVDVPIIVADSHDVTSLSALVKQTRLVISVVGPYLKYGHLLVQLCAENGVHYVDLTGEGLFIFDMIQQNNTAALSSKALIIHGCGFDSIPADLTAYLAVQQLKSSNPGVDVGSVLSTLTGSGAMSGGTLASALELSNHATRARQIMLNAYSLSPVAGKQRLRPKLLYSSTFNDEKTWGSYWFMGTADGHLVRRSWGILESARDASTHILAYGPNFTYEEFVSVRNPVLASILSVVMLFSLAAFGLIPFVRTLAAKYGPQPGSGPSEEKRRKGWFQTATVARSVDGTKAARATIRCKLDPGYAGTAVLLVESALAVLLDYQDLPPIARGGGILTPATALGPVLSKRLNATKDVEVIVEDEKKS